MEVSGIRRQHRGRRSLKAEIRRAVRRCSFYDREVKEFINLLDLHPYWQGEVLYDRFGTGSFAVEDRQIVMNSLNVKSSRWGSELTLLLQAPLDLQPQLKIFRGN